ncbi:MAG: aromatic ring-hydroxylating oxygenase subunit alpha [bacterium]
MQSPFGDAFAPFARDGAVRRGLPALAYRDDAFHHLENARLFARHWMFVGFAHAMPSRGDVRPLTAAGAPVLLVRDERGDIGAFHNVCRHRCLQLVAAPGNAGRMIRCPYHRWAYDLQGALRAAPYFGGDDHRPPAGFDFSDNGLARIRCAVWHDWIFINLDGDAAPFDDFIAPLAERLAHLDLTRTTQSPPAMLDFGVVEANWKLLMENFIEPYHVQFVHSTTTDLPLVAHRTWIDRHCLGCTARGAQDAANRTEVLAADSSYLTLFPNFVLGFYAPDQLGVHLNTPINARQTAQQRAIYLLRDQPTHETTTGEIAALTRLWREVHGEDHAICERMQRGRESAIADDGGWLSPRWEASVRRFQELVYDAVGA